MVLLGMPQSKVLHSQLKIYEMWNHFENLKSPGYCNSPVPSTMYQMYLNSTRSETFYSACEVSQ